MSEYKCSKCKGKGFCIENLSAGQSYIQLCWCCTPLERKLESKKEMFMYDKLSSREKNIYEYAFDIGMQEGNNYGTPETLKKSEWLQFNKVQIKKRYITSYYKQNNNIHIRIVSDCYLESYETEQEAQSRFEEIDKEIRK